MILNSLMIVFMLMGNLAVANGTPAEAANEDVPKPPPGFSPGGLTVPRQNAPKESTGSGNGAAPKTNPSSGAAKGTSKPAASGGSRGR
jgi:hypothetical protein